MSFLTLADGSELSLRQPTPAALTPQVVAHSLAQINRFNGHCRRPYSVAEHSLLVADIAARELGLPRAGQLAALLHDAHECVTGDQPSPSKPEIGRAWAYWEHHWQNVTWQAFDLGKAMLDHGIGVHRADRIALATERRDLCTVGPTPWPTLQGIDPVAWADLNTSEREGRWWFDWRDLWLAKFEELSYGHRTQRVRAVA